MCASIKTTNRCWKVKKFAFMHPLAKYPIFKFSDFAIHFHHTYQMHRRTLPSWNRPYQQSFTIISRYCWSFSMILTFHWVREWKISNNLIFMWIMRSFVNPVKKTLKGDTSDLLGDNSISLRFYQFKQLVIFPKLCLYNGDIYHLGLGCIISFIKRE